MSRTPLSSPGRRKSKASPSPSRSRLNSSYEARLRSPRRRGRSSPHSTRSPSMSPSRNGLPPQVRRTSGSFGQSKASPRSALQSMGMGGMVCSPMSAARTNAPSDAPPPPSGNVGQGTVQLGMPPPPARPPSSSTTQSPTQSPSRTTPTRTTATGRMKVLASDNDILYSDRMIPSRSGSNIEMGYTIGVNGSSGLDPNGGENRNANSTGNATGSAGAAASTGTGSTDNSSSSEGSKEGAHTYSMLLRTELLGMDSSLGRRSGRSSGGSGGRGGGSGGSGSGSSASGTGGTGSGGAAGTSGASGTSSGSGASGGGSGSAARITARGPALTTMFKYQTLRRSVDRDIDKPSLSPVGSASARLLASPRKAKRKIPKVPFKVLDAPALQDDFYLNLVDWSSQNILAVGLGSCVYLWSACTSKVTKLCDLGTEDPITSVAWTQRGSHVSVGTTSGDVQVWDATKCKKIRSMSGHQARVGTMAWNSTLLASGSRDRSIYIRDIRADTPYVSKLTGHRQEVCGLKWSFDDQQLASGGNDNKLLIWNLHSTSPVTRFTDHSAAVKAIAWSPHQHGLLSSGGGTADRCIRFWNTLTGTPLNCIDTGSQVCNLMWSKNVNEIVSTHGYSLNQIIVWRYPSMSKIATLTGHTYRVLYLAMSPDGQTIVTGAGDETLRFWNVFPGLKNKDGSRLGTSLLFPSYPDIR